MVKSSKRMPPGSWVAVRTLDAWLLSSDFHIAAAATPTVDQDVAWRLYTRGLTPGEARTRVQIDGDRELGEQVLRMVAIIG